MLQPCRVPLLVSTEEIKMPRLLFSFESKGITEKVDAHTYEEHPTSAKSFISRALDFFRLG